MRSLASSLTGSQTPTRLVEPESVSSEWRECHDINAAGGLKLLEWQDLILKGWLGRNALGRWSAQTCGGSVPRQNGKTLGLVVPRCNFGMIAMGEEIIYTSHLQKTSTETFESIASFFDRKALKKYVKDIKTALGREQVILNNGARIKFLARTRNGGRGQHGDLLIFDEALELDADSQASFLPAISASRNPQTIYISTPPTAKSDGSVFRDIRNRALSGESERTAWFEWSVEEIGDIKDKARWYATNPSLGILIQESTVEGECEQMDADTFARERLGWWDEGSRLKLSVIPRDKWDACVTDDPPANGAFVYGVKFAPDNSSVSLCGCLKPDEGNPVIEHIATAPMSDGLGWLVDWLMKREGKAAAIVIDGKNGAQLLVERLLAAGMGRRTVVVPKTADVIAACSRLLDAVNEGTVSHTAEDFLTESATLTTRRRIGADGGWGFQSTDSAPAEPIEACALALWQASITKRKPGRKAKVAF